MITWNVNSCLLNPECLWILELWYKHRISSKYIETIMSFVFFYYIFDRHTFGLFITLVRINESDWYCMHV